MRMLLEMRHAPQEVRTFFVTCVTAGRRRLFQVEENALLAIDTLLAYRAQNKFSLHAFVVMPDHLHLLITPAADVSLERAVQFIKGGFSFRLKSKLDVWERGRFDRRIESAQAFDACAVYIHENPIRARLAADREAYPYSSASCVGMVDPRPVWFAQTEAKASHRAASDSAG